MECKSQEILTPQVQAKFITRFPFKQYSGGVMVVRAVLGQIPDSLNFILDTGSGGISLDSATCAYYNLKATPTDTTIRGMGAEHKVSFLFNQQLHFPGLTIDRLNFHINDYDVLSSVYGEKIDGIIGYSFFSRYIVKLDFDSSQVAVYRPGEMDYPRGGTVLRPAFTTLPIQNLTFRDRKKQNFNFYFDTGAGLCFLLSEDYIRDSSILLASRKPLFTQAEGMGGRLQMRLTVVKMVQVGNYRFRNVPTYLYRDEFNVTSYPFVGGLLGNDLLRRFNLTINYPKREIHLYPNSHFKDAFDYAYTGLAIYYIDGSILVEDVIPGSPADKAGLKKDDLIIGIGKNFTNNIMAYKTILQSANENIKITISRDKKLMQLSIRPVSIL
ncbi:MAG: aspartyl protease family protein [Ferruginibacter sp.]